VSVGISITRAWAMPNMDTFSVAPIARLIGRYIERGRWIDPFARNSPFKRFCEATNDISPDFNTTHCMESIDFLRLFPDESVDGALFDPPYSPRQISECYKGIGLEVHMKDTQASFYGDRKREVARVISPGGIVISFGWNSGGIGETLGFDIHEILLVAHGGAHNDTIVTVEKKRLDLFSMPHEG
jgi:hypothetical protein